jgi:general secretion pathway protein G
MKADNGFTLVELLVTLAILSVLALVAVPVAEVSLQRTKEQELRIALRDIRTAIDAYKRAVDEGRVIRTLNSTTYPKNLTLLVEGVDDARDPKKSKIYFIRRIPRDPFHPNPDTPDAETWGLRSYASPPEDPQAGDDVYDVVSQSTKTGLNGVPYRQW